MAKPDPKPAILTPSGPRALARSFLPAALEVLRELASEAKDERVRLEARRTLLAARRIPIRGKG
jgi:hypothetical protein